MTTPALADRVTILETRFDTILPTLATKSDIAEVKTDIARLEGRVNNLETKMDAKMDALGNRLIIQFAGIAVVVAGLTVAAVKYL